LRSIEKDGFHTVAGKLFHEQYLIGVFP